MADITRIQGPAPGAQPDPARAAPAIRPPGASFGELLRARQGIAENAPPAESSAVRFSAHAQTRLASRQIALDTAHMDRLQGAVTKAAGKGSRDALVLMDDLAMVVSVKNRTVVTVVDKENLKQNVFTNIDSAVVA
ncbi:MAG TPA: TIGR02530 family flagellar biosynthesis protein [Chthonomonadaceae bacterium]|nr:TIGR02530 family flagellar biosynthesis protein [Chthonomonadaceae bacterium]